MECLTQAKENFRLLRQIKKETVLGYRGMCSFVRLRDLDSYTDDGKTAEWVLHPHAEDGF